MDDTRHRRTRMPDALQPVAACAHDHRRALPTHRAPMQGCQIIRNNLQCIQNVIKILDLTDRPQPAHRQPHGLPQDRRLANARIGHTQCAIFFLHALEALIHITKKAHILTKGHHARVTPEQGIEGGIHDLESHHRR